MRRIPSLFGLMIFFIISGSLDHQQAFATSIPDELPLLQAYVTNGEDPILSINSNYGFKVQVGVSSTNSSDTVDMQPALYMSDTIFTQDCGNYVSYSCSSYSDCYQYSTASSKTLPYFTVSGAEISTSVNLDYTYWKLDSKTATLATQCSSTASNYGSNTKGLIGLGTANRKNFNSTTNTFSIYLPKDGSSGKLLFRSDSTYIDYSNSSISFSTDSNWIVSQISYLYVGSDSARFSGYLKLLFDVNTDAIGLPASVYDKVITNLNKYSVSCNSSDKDKPTCKYSGSILKLPTITINVALSTSKISIPPQVYVNNGQNTTFSYNSITLNLRSIDSSQTGKNYVTEKYQGHIILGYPFMQYYYTVFNGTAYGSNSVTIYKSKTSPNPPSPASSAQWIVLVSVGTIIVILGVCIIYQQQAKRRRALLEQTASYSPVDTGSTTVAIGTSVPQQPVFAPYPQPVQDVQAQADPYSLYQPPANYNYSYYNSGNNGPVY